MQDERDPELAVLLDEIRDDFQETQHLTGCPILSRRVREALCQVPRHVFVPASQRAVAYANTALPIGHGQTISQPYIVALMSDLIEPQADHAVLEIGTGSGYQAAVLSRLVKQVYSVEIIVALAAEAEDRLRRLGVDNVAIRVGNGRLGWPEHAPYDAIIVTAAAEAVPPALIGQLKVGGRMVIPVNNRYFGQDLRVIRKVAADRLDDRSVLPVVFVPLTGVPEAMEG